MARALWKGAISFGLVNIPVELYPAEDHRTSKFSMLDKRDFSPVGYKRFSKTTGKEVEWSNVVKGFEYETGRYVVLSDEDFRRANVKATQTIDIRAFVGDGDVPAAYFESPYYLAPDKRGQKVYALLREALKATHRIGIAQVVIRTTQHLAAVVTNGPALMLITLRYHNELRNPGKLGLPPENLKSAHVSPKEIDLAKRLVTDMSERWNPSEFKDTYHNDLMARIRQKVRQGQTKEITKPEAEAETKATSRSAEVIDLAELLKRSLGNGGNQQKASVRRAKPVARGKPKLSVVAGGSAPGKATARSAAGTAVRRKRA